MEFLHSEPRVLLEPARQCSIWPLPARLVHLRQQRPEIICERASNAVAVDDNTARVMLDDEKSNLARLVWYRQAAPPIKDSRNLPLAPANYRLVVA